MQLLINKINSLNWFKDHFLRKPHGHLDKVVEELHTQKSIYTSTSFGTIPCQEIEKTWDLVCFPKVSKFQDVLQNHIQKQVHKWNLPRLQTWCRQNVSRDTKHVQNVFEAFGRNLYINFSKGLFEKVCVARCYYSRNFRRRNVNFNHSIMRYLHDKMKFEKF